VIETATTGAITIMPRRKISYENLLNDSLKLLREDLYYSHLIEMALEQLKDREEENSIEKATLLLECYLAHLYTIEDETEAIDMKLQGTWRE
jgi:hypothetical protein